ncbi:hypothetical protein [Massilia phyllostachyos]|uniref:hypothetical protein n=1 Tax=Massilia phyllostachyos TaxID=2898585 RepID=UPI0027D99816|nr:hypothetical protein [Massilia phyllostachyos]
MWIVAVAWIYVVALMAATEPSIVHGLMTFLCYCVLPLSILFYLTGSKRRRARRAAQAQRQAPANRTAGDDSTPVLAGAFGNDFLIDRSDSGNSRDSNCSDSSFDGGSSCDGGGGGGSD